MGRINHYIYMGSQGFGLEKVAILARDEAGCPKSQEAQRRIYRHMIK